MYYPIALLLSTSHACYQKNCPSVTAIKVPLSFYSAGELHDSIGI